VNKDENNVSLIWLEEHACGWGLGTVVESKSVSEKEEEKNGGTLKLVLNFTLKIGVTLKIGR
jgi:hypothetical protein